MKTALSKERNSALGQALRPITARQLTNEQRKARGEKPPICPKGTVGQSFFDPPHCNTPTSYASSVNAPRSTITSLQAFFSGKNSNINEYKFDRCLQGGPMFYQGRVTKPPISEKCIFQEESANRPFNTISKESDRPYKARAVSIQPPSRNLDYRIRAQKEAIGSGLANLQENREYITRYNTGILKPSIQENQDQAKQEVTYKYQTTAKGRRLYLILLTHFLWKQARSNSQGRSLWLTWKSQKNFKQMTGQRINSESRSLINYPTHLPTMRPASSIAKSDKQLTVLGNTNSAPTSAIQNKASNTSPNIQNHTLGVSEHGTIFIDRIGSLSALEPITEAENSLSQLLDVQKSDLTPLQKSFLKRSFRATSQDDTLSIFDGEASIQSFDMSIDSFDDTKSKTNTTKQAFILHKKYLTDSIGRYAVYEDPDDECSMSRNEKQLEILEIVYGSNQSLRNPSISPGHNLRICRERLQVQREELDQVPSKGNTAIQAISFYTCGFLPQTKWIDTNLSLKQFSTTLQENLNINLLRQWLNTRLSNSVARNSIHKAGVATGGLLVSRDKEPIPTELDKGFYNEEPCESKVQCQNEINGLQKLSGEKNSSLVHDNIHNSDRMSNTGGTPSSTSTRESSRRRNELSILSDISIPVELKASTRFPSCDSLLSTYSYGLSPLDEHQQQTICPQSGPVALNNIHNHLQTPISLDLKEYLTKHSAALNESQVRTLINSWMQDESAKQDILQEILDVLNIDSKTQKTETSNIQNLFFAARKKLRDDKRFQQNKFYVPRVPILNTKVAQVTVGTKADNSTVSTSSPFRPSASVNVAVISNVLAKALEEGLGDNLLDILSITDLTGL